MLSKHPGRCRFPHGHSRRIEVVIASPKLDDNDMVCDFKAVRYAVQDLVDRFDHAMALNSKDPFLATLADNPRLMDRVITFENTDPTTEVLAKHIYDALAETIRSGREFRAPDGVTYRLPTHLTLERVRVGETSSSWAEYGR